MIVHDFSAFVSGCELEIHLFYPGLTPDVFALGWRLEHVVALVALVALVGAGAARGRVATS